jgi:hypothetical protein
MSTPIYPTTLSEPVGLRTVGAVSGTAPTASRTIATTHVSEPAGFGGETIILVLRNKTAAAFAAAAAVQVQTSNDDFVNISSPPEYGFDMNGCGKNDVMSFRLSGPPGQKWQVLNSTGGNIEAEFYIAPNRS